MTHLKCSASVSSRQRIATLLRNSGWRFDDEKIEILQRREGLEVPQKHPKRNPGSFATGSVAGYATSRTAFLELGSHSENGCIDSFNARLRDEAEYRLPIVEGFNRTGIPR